MLRCRSQPPVPSLSWCVPEDPGLYPSSSVFSWVSRKTPLGCGGSGAMETPTRRRAEIGTFWCADVTGAPLVGVRAEVREGVRRGVS